MKKFQVKDWVNFEEISPQFSHIKMIYALEENKTLKVAHKLKKVLLNPSNITRTSSQHALGMMLGYTSLLRAMHLSIEMAFLLDL